MTHLHALRLSDHDQTKVNSVTIAFAINIFNTSIWYGLSMNHLQNHVKCPCIDAFNALESPPAVRLNEPAQDHFHTGTTSDSEFFQIKSFFFARANMQNPAASN